MPYLICKLLYLQAAWHLLLYVLPSVPHTGSYWSVHRHGGFTGVVGPTGQGHCWWHFVLTSLKHNRMSQLLNSDFSCSRFIIITWYTFFCNDNHLVINNACILPHLLDNALCMYLNSKVTKMLPLLKFTEYDTSICSSDFSNLWCIYFWGAITFSQI